jgi:hypothetical protein
MFHFYCFNAEKKIIVSDLPLEKVRLKYGFRYEVLNSVKDKDAIEVVWVRIQRSYPGFEIIEDNVKPKKPRKKKKPVTAETRRKMADAKRGKKKSEETKRKTSMTMKGKSNFEGKKHSHASKRKIAAKSYGNTKVRGRKWVHDPNTTAEKRVVDRLNIPRGFLLGRDYYMVENMRYNLDSFRRLKTKRVMDDTW